MRSGAGWVLDNILCQRCKAATEDTPVVALIKHGPVGWGDRQHGRSAIGFPSMLYPIDSYGPSVIVYVVQDAIHSHTQAVVCGSPELLGIGWARVFLELVNMFSDQPGIISG